MARAETKRDPSAESAVIARGLRESALWIFGALALILFVALASHDPSDAAFSSTGQHGPVENLIGPVGAWLSDLFFVLFGAPAYLFPVLLAVAGWSLYRAQGDRQPASRRSLGLRGLGFALALATSCGLATLHYASGSLPSTAGGVLGALVGDGLASVMSFLGATLLLLAVWLASVSLFTGVSWLAVMDRIGQGVLAAISWVRDRASTARDVKAGREVKQARQEVVREEQKKAAEAKSKQKVIEVKEVKFRPGTDENDYQIKLRNVIKFLAEGDKAKITLRFRGREMAHQEIGMRMLERIKLDLEQQAMVEQFPKMEGRQLVMMLAPKKKTAKA